MGIVNSEAALVFGHGMLPLFFHNYTQFNHGAYGGTPRSVISSQYDYVAQMESDIDPWMNSAQGYRACIVQARESLAELTNVSNVNDTVLVDNATEGINVILRTLDPPLGEDDIIFDLSTEYSPFVGLYQWLESRYGTSVVTADIAFPVTGADSFLIPVKTKLAQMNVLPRIAVISHISAYPSVVLPVAELVGLFHQFGVTVIVDGAHALGNIRIDINGGGLGDPDYYFANAHKWLFSSKSAAFLYVRKDRQTPVVPMLVDNSEVNQAFTDRFIW
jgi:isopenicillin-N epimerase